MARCCQYDASAVVWLASLRPTVLVHDYITKDETLDAALPIAMVVGRVCAVQRLPIRLVPARYVHKLLLCCPPVCMRPRGDGVSHKGTTAHLGY